MIRQDSEYFVFCTGMGVATWSSTDRVHWHKESPVFTQPPAWAVQLVPGFRGHIWAPDISLYQGKYCLFYAVSTFGSNRSCIGLAVSNSLQEHFTDKGMVLCSLPGRDLWNAIEAPFVFRHGGWYYLFASFDYCCRGAASNYRVMVGRSREVYGPYVDREGVPLIAKLRIDRLRWDDDGWPQVIVN